MNLDWTWGTGEWDELLERHETDLALLDKRSATYNLMQLKSGWSIIHEDELCAVFAHESTSVRQLDEDAQRALDSVPADGDGLLFP
jgi:hypothetical protein